ncbi:hypothetical protein TNCV_4832411 [Trichonephila clavipes]|nr:hypothetical protein TNCV_4832411 [Trichonephila clavipes]
MDLFNFVPQSSDEDDSMRIPNSSNFYNTTTWGLRASTHCTYLVFSQCGCSVPSVSEPAIRHSTGQEFGSTNIWIPRPENE